jgi:hypothetical protein
MSVYLLCVGGPNNFLLYQYTDTNRMWADFYLHGQIVGPSNVRAYGLEWSGKLRRLTPLPKE